MQKSRKKIYISDFKYANENKWLEADITIDSEISATIIGYQHQYLLNSFLPNSKKKHTCLYFGDWCWSNALSNPLMAFNYFKHKLKK